MLVVGILVVALVGVFAFGAAVQQIVGPALDDRGGY
jgi:hypothetical protein